MYIYFFKTIKGFFSMIGRFHAFPFPKGDFLLMKGDFIWNFPTLGKGCFPIKINK